MVRARHLSRRSVQGEARKMGCYAVHYLQDLFLDSGCWGFAFQKVVLDLVRTRGQGIFMDSVNAVYRMNENCVLTEEEEMY